MTKIGAWVVAGLTLVVGCGDDEGHEASTQSNQALCQKICSRASSHKCGGTEGECNDACMEQAINTPSQCNAQTQAFLTCASKADFQCNASGEADAIGCIKQLDDLTDCYVRYASDTDTGDASVPLPSRPDSGSPTGSVDAGTSCTPPAKADSCDVCTSSQCCAQLSACAADADCAKLSSCLTSCADDDDACVQSCAASASPSTIKTLNAFVSCTAVSCAAQCSSGDTGTDPNNGEDENCLPTKVPEGYCTDPKRPVGHECHNYTPPGDCVALENVSDVFCCAN